MNQIIIMGRVGQTPELKKTQSGNEFYSLNVVSNTKKNGEDISTWYSCTLFEFNKRFMEYVKKGSAVVINGVLQQPKIYELRNGENKISLDIIVSSINFSPFGEKKKDEDVGEKKEESQSSSQSSYNHQDGQSRQQQYKQAEPSEGIPLL